MQIRASNRGFLPLLLYLLKSLLMTLVLPHEDSFGKKMCLRYIMCRVVVFDLTLKKNRAIELLSYLKLLQGTFASLHCLLVLVSRRRILHKNTSGDIPSGNPLAKFLQENSGNILSGKRRPYSFRKTLAIFFQENLFLRR